jgi:hypothetical protein
MSRSGYFNHPNKFFPKVHLIPEMQEWLKNGDDAPEDADVWGDKKPSYKSLKEILELHESSGSKKKVTKEKKKQKIESPSHSEEEVVKRKGKGKGKPRPRRWGG